MPTTTRFRRSFSRSSTTSTVTRRCRVARQRVRGSGKRRHDDARRAVEAHAQTAAAAPDARAARALRETKLAPDHFIYPLFVREGTGERRPVASMPGVFQLSVDAVREAAAAKQEGVGGVILFGLPSRKDAAGSGASDPDAPVQAAVRAIKRDVRDLDRRHRRASASTSSTGTAVSSSRMTQRARLKSRTTPASRNWSRPHSPHAVAGADIVAPSDMMDGRVGAIRRALDERGFTNVAIMSYAAKHPARRSTARSAKRPTPAPAFGDRRSHQMDPANVDEALREVWLDLDEGADIVMVKPALPYLDVISRVKMEFGVPTAAYHVSGEHAMLKAAADGSTKSARCSRR